MALASDNPAARYVAKSSAAHPNAVSVAEYEGWLTALDSGQFRLAKRSASCWRHFMQLAFWLGMQRGEILGLCWNQVV
jgi:hypothetical protein